MTKLKLTNDSIKKEDLGLGQLDSPLLLLWDKIVHFDQRALAPVEEPTQDTAPPERFRPCPLSELAALLPTRHILHSDCETPPIRPMVLGGLRIKRDDSSSDPSNVKPFVLRKPPPSHEPE